MWLGFSDYLCASNPQLSLLNAQLSSYWTSPWECGNLGQLTCPKLSHLIATFPQMCSLLNKLITFYTTAHPSFSATVPNAANCITLQAGAHTRDLGASPTPSPFTPLSCMESCGFFLHLPYHICPSPCGQGLGSLQTSCSSPSQRVCGGGRGCGLASYCHKPSFSPEESEGRLDLG